MVDFKKSREDAYKLLESTYTISCFTLREKKEVALEHYPDVWKIETEIFLPEGIVAAIRLLIALPEDFPLVLPKIFLDKHDYNLLKYIPHINTAPNVCLFDEETIKVDPTQPGQIINQCIHRAKKIIDDGLKCKNKGDFTDELIAYWTEKYDAHDNVLSCLSMIPEDYAFSSAVKILYLKQSYRSYPFILAPSENDEVKNFRSYLEINDYQVEECEGFYLGNLQNLQPPFFFTNEITYNLVKVQVPQLEEPYRRFINKRVYPKIVVFSFVANQKKLYFGWSILHLKTERPGFRKFTLTQFEVYQKFQKKDPVTRLNFETFTQNRLRDRSDGPSSTQQSYNITFAGLGSIGSNLLQFVYTPEITKFAFIDPDILTLENTNRHLLGMAYINNDKVIAMKDFFQSKNPLLQIDTYKSSVISILRSKPEVFNNADFVFIVIGKDNIEQYIFEELANSYLTKPTFILWVEPFLCGGHCLYVNAGHPYKFEDFYEDNLYNFNIISVTEYKNPDRQLLFREAGCQSSYIPYGQKNITLFLSAVIPYISSFIESREPENFRLTWKGNKLICDELNLLLSDTGKRIEFGKIEVIKL